MNWKAERHYWAIVMPAAIVMAFLVKSPTHGAVAGALVGIVAALARRIDR